MKAFSYNDFSNTNLTLFKEDFMEFWGMPFSTSLAFVVLALTIIVAIGWTIFQSKKEENNE
jgi:Tfp pilus assembly protein PilO